MNNIFKKSLMLSGSLFLSVCAMAQEICERIEMADSLYQSGKIYVVVAVLSIIFIGIIAYLILLDNKITKLEKEIKNN